MASVELIMFGIQAAVRLAQTGRTIYVENTLRGEIEYPLPDTLDSLQSQASTHADYLHLSDDPAKVALYERDFVVNGQEKTGADLYETYLLHVAKGFVPSVAPEQRLVLSGYTYISPFGDEDPFPSPMRRIAGAVVAVAVDYFADVPGALSEDSRNGKFVRTVLEGLQDADLQQDRFDAIAIGLFTSSLEALAEEPQIVTSHQQTQGLIKVAVSGIAADLKTRLDAMEPLEALDAEDRHKELGGIVLKSLLTGSARGVVENPEVLAHVDEGGERALVTKVGTAVLDLVLAEDDLGEGLRSLASTKGLDRLIKAGLRVAAEHPELLREDDDAKRDWLQNVMRDLLAVYPGDQSMVEPELFANLAYTVLKTGTQDPEAFLLRDLDSDEKPLASFLAGTLLSKLATPQDGGGIRWDFSLSRSDLQGLVSQVLTGLASHPEWISGDAEKQAIARQVLPLAIEVIGKLEGNGALLKQLLRGEALELICSALLTSGLYASLKDDDDYRDAEAIAAVLGGLVTSLRSNGLTGLSAAASYPVLHDILSGIQRSGVIALLFADSSKTGAVADAIMAIVAEYRQQGALAIPAIAERLEQTVA